MAAYQVLRLVTLVRFQLPLPYRFDGLLLEEGGIMQETSTASTQLSTIVTSGMLQGVLDEIIGLLPTILPVMIGFIALRKGISFVLNMLHSA